MSYSQKLLLTFLILTVFVFPYSVSAQLSPQMEAGVSPWLALFAGSAGYTLSAGFGDILSIILRIFLILLGVIFITLVVFGGELWLTSKGNPDQIKKAKEILSSAVIGLIIVMGGYAISFAVIQIAYLATQSEETEPFF